MDTRRRRRSPRWSRTPTGAASSRPARIEREIGRERHLAIGGQPAVSGRHRLDDLALVRRARAGAPGAGGPRRLPDHLAAPAADRGAGDRSVAGVVHGRVPHHHARRLGRRTWSRWPAAGWTSSRRSTTPIGSPGLLTGSAARRTGPAGRRPDAGRMPGRQRRDAGGGGQTARQPTRPRHQRLDDPGRAAGQRGRHHRRAGDGRSTEPRPDAAPAHPGARRRPATGWPSPPWPAPARRIEWAPRTLFPDLSSATSSTQTIARSRHGEQTDHGVRFRPYLAGDRTTLNQPRGGFSGLTLGTTRERSARRRPRRAGRRERRPAAAAGGGGTHRVRSCHVTGGAAVDLLYRDWPAPPGGGGWERRPLHEATLAGARCWPGGPVARKDAPLSQPAL